MESPYTIAAVAAGGLGLLLLSRRGNAPATHKPQPHPVKAHIRVYKPGEAPHFPLHGTVITKVPSTYGVPKYHVTPPSGVKIITYQDPRKAPPKFTLA